ncbi:MAG: phosphatidate cytidylyltransferase [Treponema sp.]|jgi:dolichol kinase|nr:phosphatidate cytidylyltransferase [Treponema sp.]
MNKAIIRNETGFRAAAVSLAGAAVDFSDLKTEILRKAIHFLIALSPSMAALSRSFTVTLLMAGTLSYTCMEMLRLSGIKVPVISSLTCMASRKRDIGRFVMGPVTLGLGALLALLFYPSPASSIAIYALAFGDGFASLVGKYFGRLRPDFLHGKSVEGSLSCFMVVLAVSYQVLPDVRIALIAALTAMAAEALPLEDYDNLVMPTIVGFMVHFAALTG